MWTRFKLKNWIVVIAVGVAYSLWCKGARLYFGSSDSLDFGLRVFGLILAIVVAGWVFLADRGDEDDD